MKIGVVGLWHLGSVYSACLASLGNEVIGIDESQDVINDLQEGKAPLFEKDLDNLISESITRGNLRFSTNLDLLELCDVIWVTADTPVNQDDTADVGTVLKLIDSVLARLHGDKLIIVSSQLPVGTMSKISDYWKRKEQTSNLRFAVVPENLRLGISLQSFRDQNPWIIGSNGENKTISQFCEILGIDKSRIISMSHSSAEMTKHAINAFLAVSVSFANEIGQICFSEAADASDVMSAVMSDPRIGKRAYLKPGKPLEGGTLLRDIRYLENYFKNRSTESVLATVPSSNDAHKEYILRQIIAALEKCGGNKVGIAGIPYKKGSGTDRRSFAVEIAYLLLELGYNVFVHDEFMEELNFMDKQRLLFTPNLMELVQISDVLVWNKHVPIENLLNPGDPKIPIINLNNPFQEHHTIS